MGEDIINELAHAATVFHNTNLQRILIDARDEIIKLRELKNKTTNAYAPSYHVTLKDELNGGYVYDHEDVYGH